MLYKTMWQNSKLLQPPSQFLHRPPPPPPPQLKPTSPSPPKLKQHCQLSRRDLAGKSSLLLFLASQTLDSFQLSNAKAEENIPTGCPGKNIPTNRAFLDVSIDGQPQGRIIIGLYENDVPNGAAKFSSLLSGTAGISYRRKEFIKIMPNYVQHGGVRSYGVDAELAKKTGSKLAVENLIEEWQRVNEDCSGTKNLAASVGIIVRDPSKPPPKLKLVAREGKLVIDEEEVGSDPNGTEFVISSKDSPELDASVLVVGKVLEGMDVVQKIGQVKTVQENTSSPYFRLLYLFKILAIIA